MATKSRAIDKSMTGSKVLLGVTGGIAAYKAATLVSRLTQAGAQVRVIMTPAATRFITPLTLQSLSGNKVLTSQWESDDSPQSQHIDLARWCDLMIVAPATADIIAKLAAGIADDVVCLTAAALPRTPAPTPMLLAPSMNADMWANPLVQRNLNLLRDVMGWQTVGPNDGWQACRTSGGGRMSEPDALLQAISDALR